MSKSKKRSPIIVLLTIALILAILAVVGSAVMFTNGFQNDFSTFYVKCDDQTFMFEQTMLVENETQYSFEAGNKLGTNDDELTITIDILPNVTAKTDFTYTVDDVEYAFSEIENLINAFNVKIVGNTFVFSCADYSMQAVLDSLYDDDVVICDDFDEEENYFKLVVSNEDNSNTVTLILQQVIETTEEEESAPDTSSTEDTSSSSDDSSSGGSSSGSATSAE